MVLDGEERQLAPLDVVVADAELAEPLPRRPGAEVEVLGDVHVAVLVDVVLGDGHLEVRRQAADLVDRREARTRRYPAPGPDRSAASPGSWCGRPPGDPYVAQMTRTAHAAPRRRPGPVPRPSPPAAAVVTTTPPTAPPPAARRPSRWPTRVRAGRSCTTRWPTPTSSRSWSRTSTSSARSAPPTTCTCASSWTARPSTATTRCSTRALGRRPGLRHRRARHHGAGRGPRRRRLRRPGHAGDVHRRRHRRPPRGALRADHQRPRGVLARHRARRGLRLRACSTSPRSPAASPTASSRRASTSSTCSASTRA